MGGDDSQRVLPWRGTCSSQRRVRPQALWQNSSAICSRARLFRWPRSWVYAIEGAELTIFFAAPRGPQ